VRLYPHQPATAFWRWFETHALLQAPLPSGYGLDLGCGDGKLTRLIASHVDNWQLAGIDPDPKEIDLAHKVGLYTKLRCTGGDNVGEPDATFDFIFSNSVLEHIPDVRPVLREARRVLKSGGSFVFTVPSSDFHACLAGPSRIWKVLFRRNRDEYLLEFDRRIAHYYYWQDSQWQDELKNAGFPNCVIIPCFERSAVQRFETIANATSGLIYKLYGGRHRPIELQRKLRIRNNNHKCPALWASTVKNLLSARLRVDPGTPPLYGCRIIYGFCG
jgi:SAM-dependent methyltransferase